MVYKDSNWSLCMSNRIIYSYSLPLKWDMASILTFVSLTPLWLVEKNKQLIISFMHWINLKQRWKRKPEWNYINISRLNSLSLFVNSFRSTFVLIRLKTLSVRSHSEGNFSFINAAISAGTGAICLVCKLFVTHLAKVSTNNVVALLVGSRPDYFGCRKTMKTYAKLPPLPCHANMDTLAHSQRRSVFPLAVQHCCPTGLVFPGYIILINYTRSPLNLNDLQRSVPSPRHVTSCAGLDFYKAS